MLAACGEHESWMGRRCHEDACDAGAGRDARVAFDAGCAQCEADAYVDTRACKSGRYEGSFEMDYRSGPAGVCGVFAQLDTNPAAGPWSFSLRGEERDGGYTFSNACLRAGGGPPRADGGAGTPPILATLAGAVDCTTGRLQATIEGTYKATSVCDIGIVSKDYFFRGTLSGRFERESESFVDGQVRWEEPPVLLPPNPGGEGTWTARRTSSTPEPTRDCLEGIEFRFPDAGTP
jgi:hypothetical protein